MTQAVPSGVRLFQHGANVMRQTRMEVTIQRTDGWGLVSLGELYAYRDLLWMFVWREFATRYKQTILGPLWHIIQPLITTVIFTVVFSRIAHVSTDGLPPALFYLSGLLAWNYFSQTFDATAGVLLQNAALFGKVYFPRLIVPLSGAVSNLIAFCIQFATFLAVFFVYRASNPATSVALKWQAIFLPVVLLQLAALSLGVGLWLAALTSKFRDFRVLSPVIIQLWMFVTPLIYPLATVPQQWRVWVALNPVAMPVETFRYLLLGAGSPDAVLLTVSIVVTALTLISGLLVFRRIERTFVDLL